MAETYPCPVEGCDHAPFKTPQALGSHIRSVHPEVAEEKGTAREVPIVEEDFATLLRKFKIKADLAANIAENISHTGGPRVFEEPELLYKRLAAWSSDIAPAKRKLIIEQWFAERGVDIPPEIGQRAGMTTEQISKAEAETKTAGEVKYVWDTESRQIRMVKESERGGTLAQAKELKKMAEEDEKAGAESPFMQDGEGHWVLNPKARVTGVELMAVQFMQQAQEKGEPVDPITAMTRAAETWKSLREGLGVGASTLPTWMTDPVAFVGAIKTITGREGLGAGASPLPAWMTDPLAFVQAIKTITGGSGGDSALTGALAEMRKSMDELKEERYRDQFAGQQKQIQEIVNVVNKALETMADLRRDRVGRTEMDIIHEIATEGIGFIKTELPGVRRDIKEAMSTVSLPPGKTPEQKEDRKQKYKQAIEVDREIDEIGRRLFFGKD